MSAPSKIEKPTFIVYEDICRRNIRDMAVKAIASGVKFRPHFKSHQSHTVGRWYRNEGVTSITVSSLSMAEYFADDGWNDITIAFPFNPNESERLNKLSAKIKINIIVSSVRSAELAAEFIKVNTGAFIEIDTGYPRSGIKAAGGSLIAQCYDLLKKNGNLNFNGFLSHFGHTYSVTGKKDISEIWKSGIEDLNNIRKNYPGAIISVGDTPSCSLAESFSGVDEIRPGNFAFYDLMQTRIGSCTSEMVAVSVLCPVVAVYPSEKKAILYCGAIHLSKDSVNIGEKKLFGQVGFIKENGKPDYIPGCFIVSLSQEHAVVEVPDSVSFTEGMTVAVMPVHSCLTMACMKSGFVIPGYALLEIMKGF